MKITCILMVVLELSLAGCGHSNEKSSALIQEPPIKDLTSAQVRVIAKTCRSDAADKTVKATHDAAYCKSAEDAWNNVPLQAARISSPVLMADPTKK